MKYMGSKSKIAKYILPIITKNIEQRDYYIEPFVGGCNVIDKVSNIKRIGNDNNKYLISMWQAIQKDWIPPERIDRELYQDIRLNKNKYPDYLVGYVGFALSFRGKWFGGFVGDYSNRDYQREAFSNYLKQKDKVRDILFNECDYRDFHYPNNSIIYFDPPYKFTENYFCEFDSNKFWDYVRLISENDEVYISEITAPNDFNCLWEFERPNHLSNQKNGNDKKIVEKLFTMKK